MSSATPAMVTTMVPMGRGVHAVQDPPAGSIPLFAGGDTPSFHDLLDIINPLQHIPIINTIYRHLTGDTEGVADDLIGGTLYGGPIGAVAALADISYHNSTGQTAGDTVLASLGLEATKGRPTATVGSTSIAANAPAQAAPPLTAGPAARLALANPASAPTMPPAPPVPVSVSPVNLLAPADTAGEARPASNAIFALNAAADAATAPATGGPTRAGDYLVFGAPQAAASGLNAGTPTGGAGGTKTFAVLGAGAVPATSLPPTPDQAGAATTPANGATASATNAKPRLFKVPPRTGPATPVATLPPPTTGPGALPGGHSQALTAQEQAVVNDPSHHFLDAYIQAVDKYREAQQRSGGLDFAQPVSTPAPASMAAPASEVEDEPESDDTLH